MIYYNTDNIIARDSEKKDTEHLSANMKEADREEIWASHHHKPEEALKKAFNQSLICLSVLKDGITIAMFGIHADNILGHTASIWLLSSDEIESIQRKFLRQSRNFINMFLGYYPHLCNWVYTKNVTSIAWLKFCGAEISNAKPYGIEGKPFHFFEFRR